MNIRDDASPTLDFKASRAAVKPEDFNPADWTIIKRAGKMVAARHVSAETRKMPKEWLE